MLKGRAYDIGLIILRCPESSQGTAPLYLGCFPPPVEHIFPLGVHISKRDAEEQRALDLVEGCGDGFESCLYPSLISHLTSGSL